MRNGTQRVNSRIVSANEEVFIQHNKAGYQKLMLYYIIKNKTHDVGEFKVA